MKQKFKQTMKAIVVMIAMVFLSQGVEAAELVGSGQYYPTLKSAFDDINNGTLTGNVELVITSNLSEVATSTLNKSGVGFASYTSVTIFPNASGLTISNCAIVLNHAENFTLDGRVNKVGTTSALTLIGASTVIDIVNASHNKISYCTLQGSGTVIDFSSLYDSDATLTPASGSNYNMINNNSISFTTKSSSHKSLIESAPYNISFSQEVCNNHHDTILNNNLSNYITVNGSVSNVNVGINIFGKNYGWVVDGNSIYDAGYTINAANNTTAVTVQAINLVQSNSTNGNAPFYIKNNFIGGTAPLCGGSNMIVNHSIPSLFGGVIRFFGVQIDGNTADTTYVQNNTIAGINISNYNSGDPFTGIYLFDGKAIISENTIGSSSTNGKIVVSSSGNASTTRGIYTQSTLYSMIDNNTIGGINNIPGNNFFHMVFGVDARGKTTTITNNLIGSLSNVSSINSIGSVGTNTAATGIYYSTNDATVPVLINNNKVMNIISPITTGIEANISANGQVRTINGNSIKNLTSTNGNANGIYVRQAALNIPVTSFINLNKIEYISSPFLAIGINVTISDFQSLGSINNNTIQYISTSRTDATDCTVYGIYNGNLLDVIGNFTSNLTTNSSGALSVVYGIYGGGQDIVNNIITIGTTSRKAYGIYAEFGYMYHNTIYIGGDNSNTESACLWTNSLYCKNNIFSNEKQNISGTTTRHLCIKQTNPTMWSNDNNLFFAKYQSNGGGVARIGAVNYLDFTSYQNVTTGQNVDSDEINPLFLNAGGSNPSAYFPTATVLGTVSNWGLPTIPQDYYNTNRNATPWMGALESQAPLPLTWKSFTATKEKNGTELKWITVSEQNTAYFEVEKSNDSRNWKTIATQTAAGNSTTEKCYEAFDHEIVFGKSYYRIKQIDNDGKFSYSEVKQITNIQETEISIYPNPCSMNTITISINDNSQTSKVTVYTLDGKMILSNDINAQNTSVDVSHLAKGTYLIKVSNPEKTYTSKFVRQ